MKIIPKWSRASLPSFQQMAVQDCSGEVGWDKKHFIG